jgi:hypothetical protein
MIVVSPWRRLVRTGGVPMLRMMNRPAAEHAH